MAQQPVYPASRQASSVMRKRYLPGLFALFLALIPAIADAVCVKSEPGWLWNYDGTMGNDYRVRMTLVFRGVDVSGVYVYASQLKDIQVSGRIMNGTDIVLDEMDAAGKVVARFEGTFPEHDPRGRFGDSKLECEIIVGSWRKLGASETLPFYLSMESGTSGTLTKRYSPAGATDDSLIHRNAVLFWRAIKSGDRRTVAFQVTYPIKVSISGRTKWIKSPKELLANYDAIFSPRYREAIENAIPHNMFVRDLGVMLGSGQVWFGPDGKVIALNNF